MKQLFADTFYWVASINPQDDWHQRVIEFTETLGQIQIITTDEVLTEVLTFFAPCGTAMPLRAIQLVKRILSTPHILVLQQTRDSLFGNAGGGKSTLSKRLAAMTGLPLVALDLIKYQHRMRTSSISKTIDASGAMVVFKSPTLTI